MGRFLLRRLFQWCTFSLSNFIVLVFKHYLHMIAVLSSEAAEAKWNWRHSNQFVFSLKELLIKTNSLHFFSSIAQKLINYHLVIYSFKRPKLRNKLFEIFCAEKMIYKRHSTNNQKYELIFHFSIVIIFYFKTEIRV